MIHLLGNMMVLLVNETEKIFFISIDKSIENVDDGYSFITKNGDSVIPFDNSAVAVCKSYLGGF